MMQLVMKEIESLKTQLLSIENILKQYQAPEIKLSESGTESNDVYIHAAEALKKGALPTYSFFDDELIITRKGRPGKESDLHLSKENFMCAIDFIMEQMCSKGIYRPQKTRACVIPIHRVQVVRRLLTDSRLLQKKSRSKYLPVDKLSFRDKCLKFWDSMKEQSR